MKIQMKRSLKSKVLGVICFAVIFFFGIYTMYLDASAAPKEDFSQHPVIFVGGYKRSGTTLMRSIIESHPDVYCGPETFVLMKFVKQIQEFKKSMDTKPNFKKLAFNSGLKNDTVLKALSKFMEVVIKDRSPPVVRHCTKDPFNANFIELFKEMFPNMKFVLMIRDVRGVFNSYVNRIHNFNTSSYEEVFTEWNEHVKTFVKQCLRVGPNHCLIVPYEHLILNQTHIVHKVANFLNLKWHDNMLNHEKLVGERIKLSPQEWSTSQVKKPVYTDAIHAWVGRLPQNVLDEVPKLVPMMARLGYDPYANNSYNRMPL